MGIIDRMGWLALGIIFGLILSAVLALVTP